MGNPPVVDCGDVTLMTPSSPARPRRSARLWRTLLFGGVVLGVIGFAVWLRSYLQTGIVVEDPERQLEVHGVGGTTGIVFRIANHNRHPAQVFALHEC